MEVEIADKVYTLTIADTEETVKNMIALDKGILPEYIYFPEFQLTSKKLRVEFLPDALSKARYNDLKRKVNEYAKKWNVDTADMALEWLAMQPGSALGIGNEKTAKEFAKIDSKFRNIDVINDAVKTYIANKNKRIASLNAEVKKEQETKKAIVEHSRAHTTKFLQDFIIVEYKVNISADPLDTFNNVILNKTTPFAFLKTESETFYKTYQEYIPHSDWIDSLNFQPNTLVFKIDRSRVTGEKNVETDVESDTETDTDTDTDVSQKSDVTEKLEEDWSTVVFTFAQDNTATLSLEINIGFEIENSEEELKAAVFALFKGIPITTIDKTRIEKGLKGNFAIPNVILNKDIFLDLVTNNDRVSKYLYLDERSKSSAVKNAMYVFYSIGAEKPVMAYLTQRHSPYYTDPFVKAKEIQLFEPYLNVRVSKAVNLEQVERFRALFSMAVSEYQENSEKIANEYNAVIPKFKSTIAKQEKKQLSKLYTLQKAVPDLFVKGYAKICARSEQPIPVPPEEVEARKTEGYPILNYPPGSNIFFRCNTLSTYPGIIANKLPNKGKFPFLPCCYEQPQDVETRRKLENYGKSKEDPMGSNAYNPVNMKIAERGKYGKLPKGVWHVLNTVTGETADPTAKFLRYGTELGPNSFLEAIMIAFNPQFFNERKKSEVLVDVRSNLVGFALSHPESVAQELYDTPIEKVAENLGNPDVIIDSTLYIGLLESFFTREKGETVKIVVFSRDNNHPNGNIELPRYTQGYLYSLIDPKVPTAIVYKHIGEEGDHLDTPHYELIVKIGSKGLTTNFQGGVVSNLRAYFSRTYKLYQIGYDRYYPSTLPLDMIVDARGQVIDNYGKTRGFVFDQNVYLITSPLSPDPDLGVIQRRTETAITLDTALSFVKKYADVDIRAQTVDEQDRIVGLLLNVPKIAVAFVPVIPSATKVPNIPETTENYALFGTGDLIQTSAKNRRIATFLMQYVLYSYSLQLNRRDNEPTLVNANNFFKTHVAINPSHDYQLEKVGRKMTLNNSFFKDEKLIVDSQKTYDNLRNYMRFMVLRAKKTIVEYYKKEYLDEYYENSENFTQRPDQSVFVGEEALYNWINVQERGVDNQVYTRVNPETQRPYFFVHWALNDGQPVVVQNVKGGTLGRALSVVVNYYNRKINVGYNAVPILPVDHIVYSIQDKEMTRRGAGFVSVLEYEPGFYAGICVPRYL